MSELPASPEGFLKAATGYIKNPLGIIGLFIGLIYAVACIVTGVSPTLTEQQRWVFVIFSVLFPFPVLGVFYRLVTKYPRHLYAPTDWKDERHFFGPQTASEREEREERAADLLAAPSEKPTLAPANKTIAPVADNQPAIKPPQATQSTDLRGLARRGEELAFRWLTKQFKTERLYRDIRIDGPNMVAFDAAVSRPEGKHLVAIEVKTIRSLEVIPRLVAQYSSLIGLATANVNSVPEPGTIAFMLVVVTMGLDKAQRTEADILLRRLLAEHGRSVDLRVLSFEDLEFDFKMSQGG